MCITVRTLNLARLAEPDTYQKNGRVFDDALDVGTTHV